MSDRLGLAPRVRMKHDAVRGGDVLLVPESVLELNVHGAEVLRLCDGTRTLEEILVVLATRYPGATLDADVRAFVARLETRGFLTRA